MRLFTGDRSGSHATSAFLAAVSSLVFAGTLGLLQVNAQTASQAAEIAKNLTEHSRMVISRLTELDNLPAEEWRFHSGDLAHGESPDLDDSSWQVAKVRTHLSNETVWFRRWVEVPQSLNGYDLTGARIWFSFRANANGPMPEIIYFNGRRVALG